MHKISIEKASEQFAWLVQEAVQGEDVVITQAGKPVVKLVAIPKTKTKPVFGSAKGQIEMSDDFDAPLEDFKEYM